MQPNRRLEAILLAGCLLALTPAVAGAEAGRWAPFGPSDGPILSFALDPAAAGNLVAGLLYGGVIRSTDGGGSWRRAGLDNEVVTELAASSASLYAVTATGKIFAGAPGAPWRSLYGGEAFRAASPDDFLAARLAVGRAGNLFLGLGGAGLFRSVDGGRSWQPVLPGNPPISCVAIDPTAPSHVYAGAESALFKSTDSGRSWTSLSLPPEGFPGGALTLVIAPTLPSTIYAGASGLYRSTDGAATWTKLVLGSTGLDWQITGLAIDPRSPRIAYAATRYAVWASRDGGTAWMGEAPTPLDAARALAVDPHTGRVYGASADTVGRSAPGGRSWQAVFVQPGPSGVLGRPRVVFDPVDPSNVALLGSKSLLSPNGGRNWSNFFVRIPARPVLTWMNDLAFHPTDPGIANIAAPYEFLRSADHGASWTRLPLPPDSVGFSLALAVPGGRTVLAGGCGIARSADGGATWRRVLSCDGEHGEIDRSVGELQVDPQDRATIYAEVVEETGPHPIAFFPSLFRSRDGGLTWREILAGSGALALDPRRPRALYAVKAGEVLKSPDRGETWLRAGGGLPSTVSDLRIDPAAPATLYASTLGEGVFRSTDAGATWSPINDGLVRRLGDFEVSRLAVSKGRPHSVYAVARSRVLAIRFDP